VALPCIYVLQPNLVHILYFSSLYLSAFLTVVSTSLKILHSFLYGEYINHIHLPNIFLTFLFSYVTFP
jgi:hypothetical protein